VEMLDRLASGGRLLDIGCGTGDFLVHAQQAGWEVAGVELSERAAAHARGRGLDVRTGALADQEFHPDSFDVATVWDVLEHLPQPRLELMAVRCLLKPGGMLVVRVPNVRAQIMRMYATKVLGKPGGAHLQADLHLNHFTPRTLTLLLERSGFAVFRQEPGVSDDRVFSDGFSLWEKKYYCKLARMIARLTSIQIGLTVVQYARRL
jgi:SAM-dependent methyltransferase